MGAWLTVAYFALVPEEDVSGAQGTISLYSVENLPPLAFDHAAIIQAAVARLRAGQALPFQHRI